MIMTCIEKIVIIKLFSDFSPLKKIHMVTLNNHGHCATLMLKIFYLQAAGRNITNVIVPELTRAHSTNTSSSSLPQNDLPLGTPPPTTLRPQAQLRSPLVSSSPLTDTVQKIRNETGPTILFLGSEDTARESFTVVGMCGNHIQVP